MTLSARNQGIVDHLVAAHRQHKVWAPPSFAEALSMEEGYAIQDAVGAALGWFPHGPPKAWKAGGKAVMTAAPLPQVLSSPATWPGAGYDLLIEAELAFRLARAPAKEVAIESCLDTMCVSIEIVASRIAGGTTVPTAWKLADQYSHAGLVIGAETPYSSRDWDQQPCHVAINGVVAAQTKGSHPSGHPLFPLPWLADHAAVRTGGLRAGDLVTTGAWAVLPVRSGDTVEVRFEGIGEAAVRIG